MSRRGLWYIFCLPLRAGPYSRRHLRNADEQFVGGDGMVAFILLFSVIIIAPTVLLIIDNIGTHHQMENTLSVYCSTYSIIASLTYVWCTYKGGRRIKREADDALHAVPSEHFNIRFLLLKITLVILFGVVTTVHFTFNFIECENSDKVCAVSAVSKIIFEAVQTISLLIILLCELHFKREFTLWKGQSMSVAFAILLFAHVGVIGSIFGKEIDDIAKQHSASIWTLLETMALENSLFSITILVEFLPRKEEYLLVRQNSFSLIQEPLSETSSIALTRRDIQQKEKERTPLLTTQDQSRISFSSVCIQLGSLTVMFGASLAQATIAFMYLIYSKRNISYAYCPVFVSVLQCLCVCWLAYGYTYLASFSYSKTKNRVVPSESILIGSAVVFFVYLTFEMVPIVQEISKIPATGKLPAEAGRFVSIPLSYFFIFYQTTFIINIKRARENWQNNSTRKCTVWLICLMLAIGNFSLWFGNCVWETVNYPNLFSKFYHKYWFIIKHTVYAVGIFYRFHSFMLLIHLVHDRRQIFTFRG